MAARVDPFLLQLREEQRRESDALAATTAPRHTFVLITFRGDLAKLEALGFGPSTVSGGAASGWIDLRELDRFIEADFVNSISAPSPSRPLLKNSVPVTKANQVRTNLGFNGAGVIVGVIDTGIDIFHQCFRKDDGKTRILGLLDRTIHTQYLRILGAPTSGSFSLVATPLNAPSQQTATLNLPVTNVQVRTALESLAAFNPGDLTVTGGPLPNVPVRIDFNRPSTPPHRWITYGPVTSHSGAPGPVSFRITYGREFTKDEIDTALANPAQPFASVDTDGHGTHVAGTAAGDGSQDETCESAFKYIGVAPAADLLIVKTDHTSEAILRGVTWVQETAQLLNKPAVVNVSLGGHGGAHDGSTFEEVGIDAALAATPTGFAVVVSAGNDRDAHNHVHRTLAAGGAATATFTLPSDNKEPDFILVAYNGPGTLAFQLTPPTGPPSTVVAPGSVLASTPLSGGDQLAVASTVPVAASPGIPAVTGFISASLTPPAPPAGSSAKTTLTSGTWTITLTNPSPTAVTAQLWLNTSHHDPTPVFDEDQDPNRTVTIPATARNVIAVGAHQNGGDITSFSSMGPTMDGRVKPDLCAPGQGIAAPATNVRDRPCCCKCCHHFYIEMQGTSMAAPHVTGTVALMFQKNPNQRFDAIRTLLVTTAVHPPGGSNPANQLPTDNLWGGGRLDALAAVNAVPPPAGGGGGGGGGGPIGPHLVAPQRDGEFVSPFTIHRIRDLISRFTSTPLGQQVALLVSDHFDEVFRLINTNKRVATCWHRMGGPEIVRRVARSDPLLIDSGLLHDLGTGSAEEWLARMLGMLERFGSEALRRDVVLYGDLIRSLASTAGADLERGELVYV